MENLIVIAILVAIVAGIVGYLVRAKKQGQGCIGCPYCKSCGGKGDGCCKEGEEKA